MSGTIDRLILMANQIARNLATLPDPAAATADHIASFWDPRMKAIILRHLEQTGGAGLDLHALTAIRMLAESGAPPHQTRATRFNQGGDVGHSDAG